MILISQDGNKAFNMEDIQGYFIYEENKFGKEIKFPQGEGDENCTYILWADLGWGCQYDGNYSLYSIGRFEKLKDARALLEKITGILNPRTKGKAKILGKELKIFWGFGR